MIFRAILASVTSLAAIGGVSAQTGPVKPESYVRFPQSGIACLSQEVLGKTVTHFLKGETTKGNAMFVSATNPNGQCIMLDRKKRFKVLTAEYNNPDLPDVGVIEIVGPGVKATDGAWAMTIGSVPAN